MNKLLLVVEGEGDVSATPVLLRRILAEYFQKYDCEIITQRRRDLAHLRANDWSNFKRYFAVAHAEGCPIIWLLDCDDDCPLLLLRELYKLIALLNLRVPMAFVFWVKEYEAIFLYDLDSLIEKLEIGAIEQPIMVPEKKRGVKEWISSQLPDGYTYRETMDQEAITAVLNLKKIEEQYKSFGHLVRVVEWLMKSPRTELYATKL
jgi:hypothetical protein